MTAVTDAYHARGFKIRLILGDRPIEHAQKYNEQMGIMLSIMSRDEHVPEIERYIRTVKESMSDSEYISFRQIPQKANSRNSV